jgi:hypothetical protein
MKILELRNTVTKKFNWWAQEQENRQTERENT